VEEGAAREEGMLGFMNQRADKRDKKGGEEFTNNPVDSVSNSDRPELFRGGQGRGLGDEGDVCRREGWRDA